MRDQALEIRFDDRLQMLTYVQHFLFLFMRNYPQPILEMEHLLYRHKAHSRSKHNFVPNTKIANPT